MPYSEHHTSEIQRFVSPGFIAISLLLALFLNVLPWEGFAQMARPDFLAIVLLYWCMHKPMRVGVGIAFIVGVLSDVADASLFGQHALAYSVMGYCGVTLHRRLRMFNLRQQTTQVFAIFALTYFIYAAVHWQANQHVVWPYFFGCLTSTLLWAPASWMFREVLRIRADSQES